MAYSFKGSIGFGLVYIPVELHNTVKSKDISFHQLDRKTGSRVKYIKSCVDCDDRVVKQEDIVRGYEYEKDKYVLFENEDFEKIKTQKDKNITIEQFVELAEIDPIYYDKPYYVVPTGGDAAFALLLAAMQQEGKAGIAKAVIGNKETLIAIRAKEGEMLLNTMFFSDEIRSNPAKKPKSTIKERELEMAKTIIKGMSEPFEPDSYTDDYRLRLEQAIRLKIEGKEIVSPKERSSASSATDLMEALQASLENMEASKPAKPKKKTGASSSSRTKGDTVAAKNRAKEDPPKE